MNDINTQESFDAYRSKFGLSNDDLESSQDQLSG